MYSNAQILAAIINRVGQPIIQHFVGMKLHNSPVAGMVENWIRNTGIAGPEWNLASGLMPFMEPVSGAVIEPFLANFISNVPDPMIPSMAHSIIDKAIKNGGMSFGNGMIELTMDDLTQIKKLLNANMPYSPMQPCVLKEEIEKTETGKEVNNGPDDGRTDSKPAKHA